MNETCAELQRVDDGVSDELREQIRTMVDAKYLVDALARDKAGRRLVEWLYDSDGPRNGAELFRDLFPFAQINHDGEPFSALVPTAQAIGASWRWTTRSLSEEKRARYLTFLLAPERASAGARERAEHFWIKPLGLFLAHEGKNRVGFFRDMRVDWIPARVFPCRYVAADRLSIYRIGNDGEHPSYWAVLDGKWLEPMQHPSWALPVLRAYGVQVHQKWPAEFPSIQLTAAALNKRPADSISRRRAALNLPLVREKDDYQRQEIACSLLDVGAGKLSWRYVLWAGALTVAAFAVLAALPPVWSKLRIVAALGAGAGTATMLLPSLRVLRLPRRFLDPYAAQRKFAGQGSAPERW